MIEIPILYNEKMWCDNGHEISPSSKKPKLFTDYVLKLNLPCKVVSPSLPLEKNDFYRAHNKEFVDNIFNCKINNGFGNISEEVNETLPWTSASMYYACKHATSTVPSISPTSGFHHAEYASCGGFCTFNGILVSSLKLLEENPRIKIAILDMDAHFGNGGADIIEKLKLEKSIYHNSFGKKFPYRYNEPVYTMEESNKYIQEIDTIKKDLQEFKPDIIMYQAGADVHIDDMYGGILTTQQMIERDTKVFTIARDLKIPLVFNLAGGYQVDKNGDITKVLDLHVNTVKAAISVYS